MLRAVSSGLALIVLLASAAHAADEPVTLRYKMDKDAPLIYRIETEVKQKQTLNNMEIAAEVNSTDVPVRTLQKVDENGNLQIQTENKVLKFKINTPVGLYEFDSQSTERDTASILGAAAGPYFDRLSGAILTLVVSPRGELLEVKGYSELIGDLLNQNPLLAQFAGGGSDAAARQSLSEQFVYLSEKPVKPGDTWEQPFEIELAKLGKMQGKTVYKYIGTDKVGETPTAKISVTNQMDFDLNVDAGEAQVTGRLSISDSNGTVQFDPEKGILVSKTVNYTMGGNLNVAAGGNNIPFRTDQTQSVKVELLDKLPE